MTNNTIGQAGAATVDITPIGPIRHYSGPTMYRGPEAEDSNLLAHALVLSDGNNQIAIVSTDIPLIARPEFLAMRELCELRTGIPAGNIFIGATHNHSAPCAGPTWVNAPAPDPLYMDQLTRSVGDVVQQAQNNLQPARIAAGQAPTEDVTFNRRLLRPDGTVVHTVVLQQAPYANDLNPDFPPAGPVDEDVGYVMVEQPDGTPIACLMSFSCHCHSSGAAYYHRDMFGRAGDAIRQKLGADIPTPFMAGACGDTMWVNVKTGLPNPEGQWPCEANLEYTWKLGHKIADAVLASVKDRERFEINNLKTAKRVMEIPDRSLDDSEFCEDNCRGHDAEALNFARTRYGPERLAILDRGDSNCLVEVGALSISDRVAMATNPAELFVALGLQIKERSPFEVTLISELTNGYCGYVPTEEAFKQKGYETHRGVWASRLEKTGGQAIADGCLDMLNQCKTSG